MIWCDVLSYMANKRYSITLTMSYGVDGTHYSITAHDYKMSLTIHKDFNNCGEATGYYNRFCNKFLDANFIL